jgi:hypothetical protein
MKIELPQDTWHPQDNFNGYGTHTMHGPQKLLYQDRVPLWDVDQVWDFNPDVFDYQGGTAPAADGQPANYMNGFKDILYNDRVKPPNNGEGFEMDHFNDATVWGSASTSPRLLNLTRWGASDGTSRTNAHSISCWADNPMGENAMSGGVLNEFKLGNVNTQMSRRACMGMVNSHNNAYWSYAARPNLWPYNYGSLRSIETKGRYNGLGAWGVVTMGTDLFGRMGVSCNYLDLFARRDDYNYLAMRMDTTNTPRMADQWGKASTWREKNYGDDNNYGDKKYFFGRGGFRTGPNVEGGDVKLYFSGSSNGCCANAPLYPRGSPEVRQGAGTNYCARITPNNWDFPMWADNDAQNGVAPLWEVNFDHRTDMQTATELYPRREQRAKTKQTSIHFHTCADIRNATHFSLDSLETEVRRPPERPRRRYANQPHPTGMGHVHRGRATATPPQDLH